MAVCLLLPVHRAVIFAIAQLSCLLKALSCCPCVLCCFTGVAGAAQRATEYANELSAFFKRVTVVRLAGKSSAQKTGNDRHDPKWQLERRRHLARSRNRLLWTALGQLEHDNIKWVLWLDVDVRHVPRDLIRYLLSANQSIVVPNCLWRMDNGQVGAP